MEEEIRTDEMEVTLPGDGEAGAQEADGRKSRFIWLKAALLPLIVAALFVVGRQLGLGSGLEEAKDWFLASRMQQEQTTGHSIIRSSRQIHGISSPVPLTMRPWWFAIAGSISSLR